MVVNTSTDRKRAPAPEVSRLGGKVRALRRRESISQVQLATRLGISPSYLNLIESNRRPLTAPLLIKLAGVFALDLSTFAAEDDARLTSDLLEVFTDPMFEEHGLMGPDVKELAGQNPAVGRAVLTLYRGYQTIRKDADMLASRLMDGQEVAGMDRSMLPNEEVSELIQRHMNHFAELEDGAERLWLDARLDKEEMFRGLSRHLQARHGIEVTVVRGEMGATIRRYDQDKKQLTLSEWMPPRSRNFQLAHQIALLEQRDVLARLANDKVLTSDDSRALMRVALANYFAGAVLMPYTPFLEAARAERNDIELLGHRFRTSFEQACHRLTTLRRHGAEGVPFHMIRIDIAGNISKRFSASGIHFARFSGACPRWNVFAAFMTPGMIRTQVSRMPDGTTYFCLARTIQKARGGYHAQHATQAIGLGCRAEFARALVYSDGVDLENMDAAVPVGVTCRLCDRTDCEQRAFPSVRHGLRVDENVRTVSIYEPVAIHRRG